ncbi:hypothetical protein BKA64DRAFT_570873 [Cadophora sp. MPI-SDFR-AT-0126]|nr:hypothetical protein BKA64DRAFT_570873 [Leotiomycetes sp. MPI-SDFR-AT-0126]
MDRIRRIQSQGDLTELTESYNYEGDDDESLSTFFSYHDDEYNAYVGSASRRKWDLTVDDFNNLLQRVPDEHIYPEPPRHFTPAPECLDGYHVKLISLSSYENPKDSGVIPNVILDEVAALEMVSATPHPNIAKYNGCIVKRGRLVGIVLERYASTLEDRVEDSRPFDKKLLLDRVKSAIDHVHLLGLAHNDINPANIMLDENDTAFPIDIGSCKPVGEDLVSGGTPGWIDEASKYHLSQQSNDLYAFSKMQEWIENLMHDAEAIAYMKSGEERFL